MSVTIENITDEYDDIETYSVYHNNRFYRIEVAFQSEGLGKEAHVDRIESVKDYEGEEVTDEELKEYLVTELKKFIEGENK